MDFRLKWLSIESTNAQNEHGQGSYGHPKLAQPSSFPAELGQESPTKEVSSASHSSSLLSSSRRAQLYTKRLAHARELSSNQRGQLMQESSALLKEVSSCRRAQHCSKRSAHAGELCCDAPSPIRPDWQVRTGSRML